jgi:DNA-directed RNA polymerase subunit K/omega
MIQRPETLGKFEFVILATLRAAQLMRGSIPRVPGEHKATVTAQFEVAAGKIVNIGTIPVV